MPNRLADSTSPYLLQHKDNPVDWHEWGEEAFARAEEADRPILLSVGYSACHWCHVMAHESFEDDETARYMNTHFINIKVDREERPDVDRIYMDAVQAMTGRGGWPMTVFLTPGGEPFFAGTYFPRQPRGTMPSFLQVLAGVVDAWTTKRPQVADQGRRLADAVAAGLPAGSPPPTAESASKALSMLEATYDPEWGGFGGPPKFPQAPVLEFLLRTVALEPETEHRISPMLRRTLDSMRAGGIYDQLGGGFARYSVDNRWLIPHFEKMLYDNALLARIYLRAGQTLAEPSYTATAIETLDYLATEMRDPEGGIYAAEDADSEGVEGKYYVWGWEEFEAAAGPDTEILADLYGVTPEGNFEGANNLHLAVTPAEIAARRGIGIDTVLASQRRGNAALLAARSNRVRPGRDDKVIAAWNGLALRAFAEAAAVLDSPRYLSTATGIARFVVNEMVRDDGRLMRSWRRGRVSGPGFCDDYAAMAVGLATLYQVTGETSWYDEAKRLATAMIDLFGDTDGFYTPGRDSSDLIARPKDFADNPLPSSNSLAAEALVLIDALSGTANDAISSISRGAGRLLDRHPTAVGHLLSVLITAQKGAKEIAIVGPADARRPLETVVWERFRPECVIAPGDIEAPVPLLRDRGTAGAAAAAHVCHNFVCDLPVTTTDELRALLR
jgi:uncharacterized protein YyaL (SSP411 family)